MPLPDSGGVSGATRCASPRQWGQGGVPLPDSGGKEVCLSQTVGELVGQRGVPLPDSGDVKKEGKTTIAVLHNWLVNLIGYPSFAHIA